MNTSYKQTITRGRYIMLSLCALVLMFNAGCTKNFEEYNTDPTGVPNKDVEVISLFKPIQSNIFHNYQTAQNLSADAYAGYMMSPTPFRTEYNLNYSMVDGWNSNGFKDMYTYVMFPLSRMAAAGAKTNNPDFWAVALILKVEAMHRITDKFGPIPYSKFGQSLLSSEYDSQEKVYNQFFLELDTAVNSLQTYVAANPAATPFASADLLFNGDYRKWIKFANSLRLRLAVRLSKVAPSVAQLQGEKAMANTGGLMTDPADDAAVAVTNGTSDLYMITKDWADNRLNASLTSYLTGFNDPRLPAYASPATDAAFAGQYIGIRIGINIPAKDDYATYATLNTSNTFTQLKAQQLMCAAESWFLKAEAGLRGWAGAGDPQTNYEKGIDVSMQQWGVNVGNYKADETSTQAAYQDPKNSANNSPALSTVKVKWNAGGTNEQKLEQVLTQKWLAVFPEGQEAWSEFRRTGYPKLFTVVNNKSAGTIDTQVQIRRLPYAQSEYNTNNKEVQNAIQLLGGPDNGGTRVWWDVNRANF
ncbi:SusD/RagB family nutrient-binding outer membrane lipoprotein [Pedobacter sp. BAL39]|uniref:SusD/RagB family nutrient-binding outer membrane lipoprotein n=1 Tax=Pedobacter sp. BAL39 TaxID=391596 RepID=UPI0012F9BA1E|nr:SusD/RagB family nutrient-binding outer membrane lipoprotein [Pedobacter sp. BAL39]